MYSPLHPQAQVLTSQRGRRRRGVLKQVQKLQSSSRRRHSVPHQPRPSGAGCHKSGSYKRQAVSSPVVADAYAYLGPPVRAASKIYLVAMQAVTPCLCASPDREPCALRELHTDTLRKRLRKCARHRSKSHFLRDGPHRTHHFLCIARCVICKVMSRDPQISYMSARCPPLKSHRAQKPPRSKATAQNPFPERLETTSENLKFMQL